MGLLFKIGCTEAMSVSVRCENVSTAVVVGGDKNILLSSFFFSPFSSSSLSLARSADLPKIIGVFIRFLWAAPFFSPHRVFPSSFRTHATIFY
jgi:hypothetical protein